MEEMDAWLKEALARANAELRAPELNAVADDTNVFAALDSLAIVELLLETEALLESKTGRYVSLADDTIFDATKTPLRTWREWGIYVKNRQAD